MPLDTLQCMPQSQSRQIPEAPPLSEVLIDTRRALAKAEADIADVYALLEHGEPEVLGHPEYPCEYLQPALHVGLQADTLYVHGAVSLKGKSRIPESQVYLDSHTRSPPQEGDDFAWSTLLLLGPLCALVCYMLASFIYHALMRAAP
jgi:hypothetical protein